MIIKVYKYLLICFSLTSFSQPNTEIFLFDLNFKNDTIKLSNFKNISNNEGYDNQPSFMDNNTILYSGTRNGQTDIVKYNLFQDSKIWICFTEGSEYSPLKIPNQESISAIRLKKDGTQKLYSYDLIDEESEVLIDAIVIGYQLWIDSNTLISSTLNENYLDLTISDLNLKTHETLKKNVGRSLHKIPNTDLISYISKETDSIWEIKSINLKAKSTKSICHTLSKVEDMCWLQDGSILMGKEDVLYKYSPNQQTEWISIASLSVYGITNITRLAVSPDGKKLAVVGEQTTSWPQKKETQLIKVRKASKAPTIDGLAKESIWKNTSWHPINQLWTGNPYSSSDFQGRFKLTWTDEALFVLAEIIDDSIYDQHPDPLKLWWDDDCIEVFIDEDNSGGEHQYNHNAFAYHVALDGNAVDMSTKKEGILFNDHVESKLITKGNTSIWELKFSLYNADSLNEDGVNTPVKLSIGKKIGFAIAYCDNDGSVERENFIGSIVVEGEDKNKGWIDANIFGTLILEK